MGNLDGKTAIVTGASRGIGKAIASRLAADGASVVLCARDEEALGQAARDVAARGGAAAAISLDLRASDSAAALVNFAMKKFGSVDIVINNAGATKRGEFLELTDEDWADGFALKFFGAVRLTRAAWPHLKERKGSVVFISGVGGWTPGPLFAVGGSVNAALFAFTKAMADVGVRDHVQVNAINPGTIRTGRMRMRLAEIMNERNIDARAAEDEFVRASQITRIGEPEDVANLAAFVVGPEGRFLHGALIDIDGGATKTI